MFATLGGAIITGQRLDQICILLHDVQLSAVLFSQVSVFSSVSDLLKNSGAPREFDDKNLKTKVAVAVVPSPVASLAASISASVLALVPVPVLISFSVYDLHDDSRMSACDQSLATHTAGTKFWICQSVPDLQKQRNRLEGKEIHEKEKYEVKERSAKFNRPRHDPTNREVLSRRTETGSQTRLTSEGFSA
ncbi:hypothetical protein PUN28_018580 [Cardiocondyla obscurior]|uniref:Uncharacterized protein n=1 Tax=Cardiocondyla obscurior TaxID=286306 RepID=A0AAW2EEK1_9HYME